MDQGTSFFKSSPATLPVLAAALALAIFLLDTLTLLDSAVAILYVLVVLLAANFTSRNGILWIAAGCAALTLLSYVVSHGLGTVAAFLRSVMSLSAIGLSTFLVLKIQASETVLREQAELLNQTHDTIFVRDMNDCITYWNRGAEEMYGWFKEEANGTISHDLLKTIFPDSVKNIHATLLQTGRWEGELVHTTRNGTQVVVASRWALQKDSYGRPISVLETNNDISERKRAEDALRRSEAYLAGAQRLSRTGSIYWNVRSGEVFWSEESYRLVGVDPATPATMALLFERIHPDERTLVRGALDELAQGRDSIDLEFRLLPSERSVKVVHFVGQAFVEDDGSRAVIGAGMDITETKLASDALHALQAELAHVSRVATLGELSASIAHEVNQPLGAIVTNAEAALRWLDRAVPEVEEARGAIGDIVADARRATQVVLRMRAFARKADPEKAALDIGTLVQEVVQLVQRELSHHRVVLQMDLAPTLPGVLGDRIQLQQVILNLLVNGIQATSTVVDRARLLQLGSRLDDEGHVLVMVTDSGTGISADVIERLFQPFFTTKRDGMGMGLSICRSIIDAHDGRIWASSKPGEGATFSFTLPAIAEHAATSGHG
jgi:PAS domain S-box-containing protein